MGINYYLHPKEEKCKCCGRAFERKHIGKSSAGWCFALHVYPEEGIHDLKDWAGFFLTNVIRDEYGNVVSYDEMMAKITERKWPKPVRERMYPDGYHKSVEKFLEVNQAEEGPNNLLRSKIDGNHCIGHGKGTWDMIVGEFS